MNTQDLIALLSVLLPILVPLGGALYKHLVDALPSAQRQAVVDTVRIAAQAVAADPTIADDAGSAAATLLKELHLPASPNLTKSLIAIFSADAGQAEVGEQKNDVESEVVEPQHVGFAPQVSKPAEPHPGL